MARPEFRPSQCGPRTPALTQAGHPAVAAPRALENLFSCHDQSCALGTAVVMKTGTTAPFMQFTAAKRNSDGRIHSHCATCRERAGWAPGRTGSGGLPKQEPAEARAPGSRDARRGEHSVRTMVRGAGPHKGRPAGRVSCVWRLGRAPGAEAQRESNDMAQSEAGSVLIFSFNPKSVEKLSKDFKWGSKRIRLRVLKDHPLPRKHRE